MNESEKDILEKDRKWLKNLHEDIWNEERYWDEVTRDHEIRREVTRLITLKELSRVREICLNLKFPVVIKNAVFGFKVIAIIYDPPGVPGMPLEYVLLRIGTGHVLPNEIDIGGDKQTEWSWGYLSSLSHNKQNLELLEFYEISDENYNLEDLYY